MRGDLHHQVEAVIDSINRGETKAILTPLTMIEIYYVSERIYREVRMKQSEILAKKLHDYIYHHSYIEIKPLDYELSIKAAIIKTKYNIAFSECLLLALADRDNTIILFTNADNEMTQHINELKNHFNIKFLEDYM